MTKAERLFSLVTLLRSRRTAITAEAIAEVMEISVRTVYRDVRALQLSGVPVEGEAGVGYLLKPYYRLPPLAFSPDEVLAIMVGGRMVQAFTDPELARAARGAEQKIRAVLPETLKVRSERQPYRIPILQKDEQLRALHGLLRLACEEHRKVRASYVNEAHMESERVIWPLGIMGWSGRWTLLAWCELRNDYRNFRFDRFRQLTPMLDSFAPRVDLSISHYFHTVLGVPDPG